MNRGAKGIALIDDSGHKPALRYVFDVSDTNTRYNIPFRLWQTKSQYTAQIIEELTARYDAPREQIAGDVDHILEQLRRIGAIDD